MQTIHKVLQVINNQIIIEKEIDIGVSSPITNRSHKEIFLYLREKYESSKNCIHFKKVKYYLGD